MITIDDLNAEKTKLLEDQKILAERLQKIRLEEQQTLQNLSALNGAVQVIDRLISNVDEKNKSPQDSKDD